MTDDRIAIIGMACRVPGASDVPSFWRNLCAGVDSVRRNDEGAFGYLDDLTGFDAALFGYSDAEAVLLDPQHRIFLEVAWWALEDACYDPAQTQAQIGVFAGCGANRYLRHHLLGNPKLSADTPEEWDELLLGGTSDYLPTRVAYALGLTGPAVGVQTACSTSLVAVCQAAQSLLDFRCDMAIAGGAAVVSTRQRGLPSTAPDGYCRPFDADATGQVFGNGGGAVVLKRFEDAVADDDHIYAIVPGWAVNNDGAARAGFTAPGVTGQSAVVAEALAAADWEPSSVGFAEAHGSGTPIGDAIEIEALTRVFRTSACVLGSVKSNVGNLDAAAGVVGLIKAALAVQHGVIPPTLHFRKPHPDNRFTIATSVSEWSGPRRAGVSSFGLGGTNAHVLIDEAPPRGTKPPAPQPLSLPLSANTPEALEELRTRLTAYLTPEISLGDAAYSLTVGRRPLPYSEGVPAPAGRRISLPGYPFQRQRHWI